VSRVFGCRPFIYEGGVGGLGEGVPQRLRMLGWFLAAGRGLREGPDDGGPLAGEPHRAGPAGPARQLGPA
jgi:hypothetical protein